MSQKKVDEYKSKKYNRAQAMRKARINTLIRRAVVSVVALVLVIWVGFSVYDNWQDGQPRNMAEVNFQAIDDYMLEMQETFE